MRPKRFISGYLQRFAMALLVAILALVTGGGEALAERSIYIPQVSGTVRARYEYFTAQNKGAFKVRNLRIGVDGYVAPIMSYRGEVDFADWGKIILVDAYVKVAPVKGLYFSMGQLRMPFTIAAHRTPAQQYFVDRPFVAKHNGIRDVGLVGGYTFAKIPLTLQASVYNNSGTGENKAFFTNTYGYTAKVISPFLPCWYAAASTARLKRGDARVQMWDIGGYFDNQLWHVEAEYLRKVFVHGAFHPVNAFDFFVFRNFPIEKKMVAGVSGAVRYDYMSESSSGTLGETGTLIADDPERHRLTAGVTLTLISKLQADIRLNYEQYFYRKGVATPNDSRLVLELIARF